MTAKSQEARTRIDASKSLTLDERVAIVEEILTTIPATDGLATLARKTAARLKQMGYEPMMFGAACNVVASRHRVEFFKRSKS